jgi:RHS repeat-associated protein
MLNEGTEMKTRELVILGIALVSANSRAFFSPEQGRWISRDPIHEEGSTARKMAGSEVNRSPIDLYVFCANNPILYFDKYGLAYFALRPLTGWPWIPGGSHNPLDDWSNSEISHEQVFFEDDKLPSNVGFFSDNTVRSDSSSLLSGYRKTRTDYNDCVMRIAVAQTPTKPYSLLGWGRLIKFNCQDFAEDVRRKYSELVRRPSIKKQCCPKKDEII